VPRIAKNGLKQAQRNGLQYSDQRGYITRYRGGSIPPPRSERRVEQHESSLFGVLFFGVLFFGVLFFGVLFFGVPMNVDVEEP